MKQTATEERYRDVFEKERVNVYPEMDRVEEFFGCTIDTEWLEKTAFALNCPVKVNPPNWQHGRLIYAVVRDLLAKQAPIDMDSVMVDIGTAKGFSACVIAKALEDSAEKLPIYTVDIVSPMARVVRNTFLELGGFKTVPEMANQFLPVGQKISYFGDGSMALLRELTDRDVHVMFAFIDGKHTTKAVREESAAISKLQRVGDVMIFDDLQLEPVLDAWLLLEGYETRQVDIGPRKYGVARKL